MNYDSIELLADPTRRIIMDALAEGPKSVRSLTEAAGVSQPAVSQHLRKLKVGRLVKCRPDGASNIYSVDATGLASIRDILNRYWTAALTDFERLANEEKDRS